MERLEGREGLVVLRTVLGALEALTPHWSDRHFLYQWE